MRKPQDLPPFVRALEYIDDDLLQEVCAEPDAEEVARAAERRQATARKRWNACVAVAASFLFVLTGTLMGLRHLGGGYDIPPVPSESILPPAGTLPPSPTPVIRTTIAVDINPSLELAVDDRGLVATVRALNREAETVLGTLALIGLGAEEALDAVIDSAVHLGYLTEDRNSILISVDNDDPTYARQLQSDLSARVSARLDAAEMKASVITQTYAADGGEGSSAAKIALAKKIFAASLPAAEGMSVEQLCALSIEELNAILGDRPYLVVDDIEVWREKYPDMLTPQAALYIALGECRIPERQASKIYISLMHAAPMDTVFYVVRIFIPDRAYGYILHAEGLAGGTVIDAQSGFFPLDQAGPNSHIGTEAPLDRHLLERFVRIERVIRVVWRDAGVRGTAEEHHLVCTLEKQTQDFVYCLRFDDGALAYEYVVDVYTGQILRKNSSPPTETSDPSQSSRALT